MEMRVKPPAWLPVGLLLSIYPGLFFLLRVALADRDLPGTLLWLCLLSALYGLFALWPGRDWLANRKTALLLVLMGLLLRGMFFTTTEPEILSDDVYRYFWDGKVAAAGINPFLHPPDGPALDFLEKDDFYAKINHKSYPTIYPPLSQLFFLLVFKLAGNNLFAFKGVLLGADLLCLLLLAGLGVGRRALFWYFLSPLLIVEVYVGAHLDILGVAFLLGALLCLSRDRELPAYGLLLLSVLIKYLSLALLPLFLVHSLSRRQTAGARVRLGGILLGFFLALGAAYLPYIESSGAIFRQLLFYGRFWEFNALLSPLLKRVFPAGAVFIKLALLAAALGYLAFNRRMPWLSRVRLGLLSLLLLNGALYPWYLLWLLPCLSLEVKVGELFLIVVVPLSYLVLIPFRATGIWAEPPLVRWVEYLPFCGLFIFDWLRGHYVQRLQAGGDHPRVE